MRTLVATAAIVALAACGQTTTDTTTDTTTSDISTPAPAPAPTMTTLTETDARTRAETAGYTNVTGLMQNPDGTWTATGTQNGQTTSITISDSGVTAATTTPPTTTTP
jgi:curli biogenesis system outer membrane secretion channel CsgG